MSSEASEQQSRNLKGDGYRYKLFSRRVLDWFDQHGRKNLPWQPNGNPYMIWLSEIMLQQTQVATVIPYFQRFIQTFPTIEKLAKAPIDTVLALWSGLGYYARARNLKRAAERIVEEHQGIFPKSRSALEQLPGIGRSTAAAICSLAFDQRAAILDGNVKRVLARHEAFNEWPGQTQALKKMWGIAESLLPDRRYAHYTASDDGSRGVDLHP